MIQNLPEKSNKLQILSINSGNILIALLQVAYMLFYSCITLLVKKCNKYAYGRTKTESIDQMLDTFDGKVLVIFVAYVSEFS